MPRKIPSEFMVVLKPYLEAGTLRLEDGTKHAKIVRADGHTRPIPGSPSDHRALANFKCQLRRFANGELDSKHLCHVTAQG